MHFSSHLVVWPLFGEMKVELHMLKRNEGESDKYFLNTQVNISTNVLRLLLTIMENSPRTLQKMSPADSRVTHALHEVLFALNFLSLGELGKLKIN